MPFLIPPGEDGLGIRLRQSKQGRPLGAGRGLQSEHDAVHVEFVTEIPGFNADFHKLDEDDLYEKSLPGPGDHRFHRTKADLKKWVEEQPATVTNADGTKTGDPLNLVIIGDAEAVWPAFLRSGWDPTAAMGTGSVVKTGVFGIFGGAYRYAPISNLYVYGRAQDIALQKVRSNIHYRNHLRLWLAPVTVKGAAGADRSDQP